MNTFKQIFYDLRHQPVIAWVTIAGTSLAVCLMTVVSMIQSVSDIEIAPETHRREILIGKYIHCQAEKQNWSGGMDYSTAQTLYGSLPGVELVSFVTSNDEGALRVGAGLPYEVELKATDENFWKLYDFKFLAGRPYDEASVKSGLREAVLTRNVARDLFGSPESAVGREFNFAANTWHVVGVVENTTSLLTNSYAQMYVPIPTTSDGGGMHRQGSVEALILPGDATKEDIKKVVESRYALLEEQDKSLGYKYIYHGSPFEYDQTQIWSNGDPEPKSNAKQIILYLILLVVPAINLSTMTRARLQSRMSEIGVRRAFGCKRRTVVTDILAENFIITLVGGIIGFALSVVICYMFTDVLLSNGWIDDRSPESMRLSVLMIINPLTIAFTILFCFLLNLLSAGIPAWRAACMNPVEAISSSKK